MPECLDARQQRSGPVSRSHGAATEVTSVPTAVCLLAGIGLLPGLSAIPVCKGLLVQTFPEGMSDVVQTWIGASLV